VGPDTRAPDIESGCLHSVGSGSVAGPRGAPGADEESRGHGRKA
jgi:hypothetical protein